jgi:hypothetical protein
MSFRQSFEHVLRRWSGRNVAQRFQSAAPDSGGDHVDTVTSSDQEPDQTWLRTAAIRLAHRVPP